MKIGNFIIFRENLDKLYAQISGYNPSKKDRPVEGDVHIGSDLSASTRIGKIRKNQEDAVLIMKKKENPKYKMMVVADGIGGYEHGERASYIAINEMREWFNNLSEDVFKNERLIQLELNRELDIINYKINCMPNVSFGSAGTTFVCAIVADKGTYIANIGDSRAYMVEDGELIQITEDHSCVNKLYKDGLVEKDDMRFVIGSNYVTKVLGNGNLNVQCDLFYVNNSYDAILLFSDGVTDCLSDNQIYAVTKNTNPKKLAKKIVEKALKTTSERPHRPDEILRYYDEIPGGKDNATAAVLINEKKGGNHDER